MLYTILLVLLLLALIGSLPVYSYSANYGYFPASTAFVLIIIVLFLMRR